MTEIKDVGSKVTTAPNVLELQLHRLHWQRGAFIEANMIYSPAFAALDQDAIFCLIRFLQKRTYEKEGKKRRCTIPRPWTLPPSRQRLLN